ncbi:DUF748 domain-containing protein [Thauera humireducens]|uniref:DUF748 domain-containing protein n=1 Tax=Thauera humireducens TaxID=1134435 RepID=UPI00312026E4
MSTEKGNLSQLKLDSRIDKNLAKLGVSGSLGLEPLKADLKLDLRNGRACCRSSPMCCSRPRSSISRGNLTTQDSQGSAPDAVATCWRDFRGDVAVGNFASIDRLNATDFLRWRTCAWAASMCGSSRLAGGRGRSRWMISTPA